MLRASPSNESILSRLGSQLKLVTTVGVTGVAAAATVLAALVDAGRLAGGDIGPLLLVLRLDPVGARACVPTLSVSESLTLTCKARLALRAPATLGRPVGVLRVPTSLVVSLWTSPSRRARHAVNRTPPLFAMRRSCKPRCEAVPPRPCEQNS
jgi:hypothetical protein